MKYRFVALLAAFIFVGSALAQSGGAITPEQYAKQNKGKGTPFQVEQGQLQPANMFKLVSQCVDAFAQPAQDELVVHGSSIVDPDDYRINGPTALSDALDIATLEAENNAARYLKGIVLAANTTAVRNSQKTRKGSKKGSALDENKIMSGFSSKAVNTLVKLRSSSTVAVLKGGRVTGRNIIFLGKQGLCVIVKYEIPLDQQNFNPANAASSSSTSQQPGNNDSKGGGFPLPPPGSIRDF
jgi:hypothetical protein